MQFKLYGAAGSPPVWLSSAWVERTGFLMSVSMFGSSVTTWRVFWSAEKLEPVESKFAASACTLLAGGIVFVGSKVHLASWEVRPSVFGA